MGDLYVFKNPNPAANRTEDCVLRAICIMAENARDQNERRAYETAMDILKR